MRVLLVDLNYANCLYYYYRITILIRIKHFIYYCCNCQILFSSLYQLLNRQLFYVSNVLFHLIIVQLFQLYIYAKYLECS